MEKDKKMENRRWDILGIGSPLFDIVINISEEMLRELDFKKGSMNLVSAKESKDILKKFKNIKWQLMLGGSAANTLSGANTLGNRVSFLGLAGKDKYGKMFQDGIEKEGIFSHLSYHDKDVTGHVIVLITPDKERTFITHMGAAINFAKEHVKGEEIKSSKILHIEGYQLENLNNREASLQAIAIAKKSGTLVSLDLSDTALIKRNKKIFQNIVKKHIDIVFANEEEAVEFTGEKNPRKALHKMAKDCQIAVVKLGEKGSLIKKGGKVFEIKPHRVKMMNANGAGDMYAAGILHGLANELDLQKAGEIASHISALVVASPGPRLDRKHFNSISKYLKK